MLLTGLLLIWMIEDQERSTDVSSLINILSLILLRSFNYFFIVWFTSIIVRGVSYDKSYLDGKMYASYSFINISKGKEQSNSGHSLINKIEVAAISEIIRNLKKGYFIRNLKKGYFIRNLKKGYFLSYCFSSVIDMSFEKIIVKVKSL
ncbi:hypothetical protein VIGAN_04276900 [Vigna angularis var. angularis]|uniref:Uncharacterized protein n=1 Tax=Vigna angularis var. angularis TaxID=157739 RepID=A0A0S3RXC0_PHAAN|nr:hypothetical protein VIGAN_04276900 [Vigna angularis var. angularis]